MVDESLEAMLARIDERTEGIKQRLDEMKATSGQNRADIKELYSKVDDINIKLPKIDSIQTELTEHKTNHWTISGLFVAALGAILGIFEFFKK